MACEKTSDSNSVRDRFIQLAIVSRWSSALEPWKWYGRILVRLDIASAWSSHSGGAIITMV